MTVEILDTLNNAFVDITPFIAWQGLTFSRNDVDSDNAGRDMAAHMHRGRVAVKEKMQINTVPLTNTETAMLSALIEPESYTVRINPYPKTNTSNILSVYSNNVNISHVMHMEDGTDLYTMSFPMIEN